MIGFMGTGKSTVGSALAERLGWRFVDTDATVVEREGRSIPQLFEEEGEAYFRDAESAVLKSVLTGSRQVVSTGGGAVLRQANRETMLEGGFVVALTAPPDVLLARLRGDANRPLLAGDKEERVHRLLEERKNAYDFAHLVVDTSRSNVRETVESIIERTGLSRRA
ncbi:shikimate kinase [Paenibacillus antri]|uniref:Shikimate kinase n=1 Tax=Paenibacillus antri TaxID=2582848 RepID=A0A5R9G0X5_9BACL|nr:shikimate kinase [Paenibacillus antri]TLS49977.1 shikimate kinase [Paenibacillus antri]